MDALGRLFDAIEFAFGIVVETLRIALMLFVILLFIAGLLYGLQKAAMFIWGAL